MWLLYINKDTGAMEMREMFKKPTKTDHEIFMGILEFKDAATICNRYNNEVWKDKKGA